MKGQNNYLEAFLDAPNALHIILKIGRLLKAKNSHILLMSQAGMGKREYLQLSTILFYQKCTIFEPNIRMCNDIMRFKHIFKTAMLETIRNDETTVFFMDDNHLSDICYMDYVYNYLHLFENDAIEIFDEEFSSQLINTQKEAYEKKMEDPNNVKQDLQIKELNHHFKSPTSVGFYKLAISKLMLNFHIVFSCGSIQNYRHYVNHFPNFETKFS
jgi:hypothetical protein